MSEPKRDRWGRYLLPHPDTGKEEPWTRATTIANTLSNPWSLIDWKLRMAVKGIALRHDLRALASSLPLDAGKKQLNEVAQSAIDSAGGNDNRNIGTALHEWTAQLDRGEEPEGLSEPWDRDLEAYRAALALYNVEIIPEYVERIVGMPGIMVAGTFDRIVGWGGDLYIADVKTGSVEYGWGEYAVQMALYAYADLMWDEATGAWRPAGVGRTDVNRSQGLVIHLPAGQAKCELHWVDLEVGWEAVSLAIDVRSWRDRKDISRPFGVDLLGRSPVQPVLDLAAAVAGEGTASVAGLALDPAAVKDLTVSAEERAKQLRGFADGNTDRTEDAPST